MSESVARRDPTLAADATEVLADALVWFRDFLTSFSVRTKILGIVVSLTLLLGIGVTMQVRTVMTSVLTSELDNRGASVASDLAARAADPLLLNDPVTVFETLADTVQHHPDAVYAYVLERTGDVLIHTFGPAGFPSDLLSLPVDDTIGDIVVRTYVADGVTFHEFEGSIADGELGVVRVGMSEERLAGVVNGITTGLLVTTLLVALVGVAAASFLTWLLTRPILHLVDTTNRVTEGDLAVRARVWAKDEIGTLSTAFNEMVEDLEENRQVIAETEAARSRLLEKVLHAQEEERRRIATELHDTVGQSLSSIMIGLALLEKVDQQEAHERKRELEVLVSETLAQVRQISRELRPSVLDDLGLAAALERAAEEFSLHYTGLAVDVHADLEARLDPATETSLYRVVQEAITNAARHGEARNVSVLIVQKDAAVRVIIDDDGRGFDVAEVRLRRHSVGLHGMRERAELLGGSFDIESGPDGTTVYVEVPA